jgi:signal transduction histidine kinase
VAVALRKPLANQAESELPPPRGSRRISILVEFLAALVSVVLISAAGTGIFEERLTRSALAREADLLTNSRLSVVVAAYENREETLGITLRYLAERLNVSGATDPEQFTDLVAQLSLTGSSLDIDMLGVFERDGRFVAGEGRFLENSPVVTEAAAVSRSRLVPAPDGTHKRVLAAPIGTDRKVLVGGLDLSDDTALELRRTLGDRGEVILVAGGKVAGSSIDLGERRLPGADAESGVLPTEPRLVELGGKSMLLVYESLGAAGEPLEAGAIGVAVPDPVGGLTESLTLVRFLSTLVLTGVAVVMGWLLFWTLIRPLVGLSRTASRIARGDLNATFVAARNNEIGRLAGALQQMTAELQGQTRRLQEASKRLLVAQQEERQRMARDLHDGMQQQLVVLAVKIKQLAASEDPPNPLILEHLAAEAEEAAFALQDLGRGIFPTVLGDQGVPAALRTSASRLPMKVRLKVGADLEETRFSPEVEGTLYFVAMEAMANAQKHAPEAQLNIRLSRTEELVTLEVSDDGPGFDTATESLGAGLQNMADRVNAVGGSFELTTAPGAGVRILATIPLDAPPS